MAMLQKLTAANEKTWLQIGSTAEAMDAWDKAVSSYESVLRHNPYNITALKQLAALYKRKEQWSKAMQFYQRVLVLDTTSAEVWSNLGHCCVMLDELNNAYAAFHKALHHSPNSHDPNLWHGIGILYERYNQLDNAIEAFLSVIRLDANFEKNNEIYFRLGVIFKQQGKYERSLEAFKSILDKPPRTLSAADIWFQIGHVHELKKDMHAAKDAYTTSLECGEGEKNPKVMQQLGWLYHQPSDLTDQDTAIQYLVRSKDVDQSDGQTWYLLGRCYMAKQEFRKAYDAYQQAVFRDGKNPTFWCSIGVLYYQINQYRDALDAYSRAIRLNPFLAEVWYNLGTLYEACKQFEDAVDAYTKASELDQSNKTIQQRLKMIQDMLRNDARGQQAPTQQQQTGPDLMQTDKSQQQQQQNLNANNFMGNFGPTQSQQQNQQPQQQPHQQQLAPKPLQQQRPDSLQRLTPTQGGGGLDIASLCGPSSGGNNTQSNTGWGGGNVGSTGFSSAPQTQPQQHQQQPSMAHFSQGGGQRALPFGRTDGGGPTSDPYGNQARNQGMGQFGGMNRGGAPGGMRINPQQQQPQQPMMGMRNAGVVNPQNPRNMSE
eukprot:TRINITY_DN33656_c0_g1_i1.p1 TRINITY_DN33656_c0_g1~~TRINITY_DN33656_c0_g1_i1.p1  ORF type:complete len:599 (-),score=89.95 TRINITY_DN33656_c0_g1_i1:1095-2891(-)